MPASNDSVAVDHIGMLQESGGYRYITTYYDRFSGFAVSRPVRCIDALTTAFTFMNAWVTMFGAPNSLLSDNGSDFRSELFGHLTKQLPIERKFTTSYNAGCNGAVERYNKTRKTALRAISIAKDTDFSCGNGWHLYVPYINSITNSRKSRRTQYKLSPAEIFLGRSPQTPIDFKLFGLESVQKKSGGSKYAEFNLQSACIILSNSLIFFIK